MKSLFLLSAAALLLGVSACAPARPAPDAPPVSNARGSAQGAPQSANSLPDGARVNAPLAPATGVVGTTRVGPSR